MTWRCVVCREPVHGSLNGVLFGAFGKPRFAACHRHAPAVKGATTTGLRVAHRVATTVLLRKFPLLAAVLHGAGAITGGDA